MRNQTVAYDKASYKNKVKIQKNPVSEIMPNKLVPTLNILLANEYYLFTKTLNYHWNVTGPRFHSLHLFLETQYNDLLKTMDEVAERIRMKGEKPIGSIEEFKDMTLLEDDGKKNLESKTMIKNLLADHVIIIDFIKKIIKNDKLWVDDPGTEDFLIGVLQKHEEASWKMQSQLE